LSILPNNFPGTAKSRFGLLELFWVYTFHFFGDQLSFPPVLSKRDANFPGFQRSCHKLSFWVRGSSESCQQLLVVNSTPPSRRIVLRAIHGPLDPFSSKSIIVYLHGMMLSDCVVCCLWRLLLLKSTSVYASTHCRTVCLSVPLLGGGLATARSTPPGPFSTSEMLEKACRNSWL